MSEPTYIHNSLPPNFEQPTSGFKLFLKGKVKKQKIHFQTHSLNPVLL